MRLRAASPKNLFEVEPRFVHSGIGFPDAIFLIVDCGGKDDTVIDHDDLWFGFRGYSGDGEFLSFINFFEEIFDGLVDLDWCLHLGVIIL